MWDLAHSEKTSEYRAIATDEILNSRLRVPEHVVSRAFAAETLLLNLKTGQYHSLNETGGRMLELIAEGRSSVGEAVERLAEEYEVPVEDVRRDMTEFCKGLAERGLVEVDSDQPG